MFTSLATRSFGDTIDSGFINVRVNANAYATLGRVSERVLCILAFGGFITDYGSDILRLVTGGAGLIIDGSYYFLCVSRDGGRLEVITGVVIASVRIFSAS